MRGQANTTTVRGRLFVVHVADHAGSNDRAKHTLASICRLLEAEEPGSYAHELELGEPQNGEEEGERYRPLYAVVEYDVGDGPQDRTAEHVAKRLELVKERALAAYRTLVYALEGVTLARELGHVGCTRFQREELSRATLRNAKEIEGLRERVAELAHERAELARRVRDLEGTAEELVAALNSRRWFRRRHTGRYIPDPRVRP